MDPLPAKAHLVETAVGSTVSCEILKLTRELAKVGIDAKWWRLPGVSAADRKLENDHNWKWAKAVGEVRTQRWYETLAVQTADGDIQGAIQYRIDGKSFVSRDDPAVYVDGLATAPWNRAWLVGVPRFRGVGKSLLRRAAYHSYALGLNGRVNLIAFDDDRTLGFYRKCGFEIVGNDEGSPMLEIAPQAARDWLRDGGYDL
jgi:GNAT superfamily N-acetyltransferase